MIEKVSKQKAKLVQKKTKLAAEEARIKLQERKMRTRHLIEVGGLVVKAGIDFLPTNTLYGALLSLSNTLDNDSEIKHQWTNIGKTKLDNEQTQSAPVIIKFNEQPAKDIRDTMRSHGLRFNKFRSEWYGHAQNLDQLKSDLSAVPHEIELLNE